jgi:transposase-like protein
MNQPPPIPPSQTEYVPCPKCQSTNIKKCNFTWWGGILGPKLLTHVKCQHCGTTFNGKTGNSNTAAIIIYSIVLTGIVIGILFAIFSH